jgi:hypothetical protein
MFATLASNGNSIVKLVQIDSQSIFIIINQGKAGVLRRPRPAHNRHQSSTLERQREKHDYKWANNPKKGENIEFYWKNSLPFAQTSWFSG